MTTTTYDVIGMNCAHCASAVSSEIGAIAGVESVDVDLSTGAVTVTSHAPLERDRVAEAVDEAGYELGAGR